MRVFMAVWAALLLFNPGLALAASATDLPDLGSSAEQAGKVDASDDVSQEDLEKLAKMTSNPLSAAWMLWFQNDYRRLEGDLTHGGEMANTTIFQPVMSIPIDRLTGSPWNLILRPVFQYQSMPLDKDVGKLIGISPGEIIADDKLGGIAQGAFGERTNGLGDTALLALVGPDRLDGFIWGVGVTQLFPTAKEDILGQDKWQAGPAALLARFAPRPGGFNIGALAQHWWSYAGNGDREDTSMTNIQYFINYRLSTTELLGMTPNITYNWKADSDNKLTLPVGMGYSNIIKLGPMPVRLAAEFQYSLVKPDNIGSDWNIRVMFIPVVPNPFARAN